MARTPFKWKSKKRSRTTESTKKGPRAHLARVNVIYGVIFVAFGSLVLRLGYLQVTQGAEYRAKAQVSAVQQVPVLPPRGRIYDTNGHLLAYDNASYSIYYTQMQGVDQNLKQIANILAPVLKIKAKSIVDNVTKNKAYATIRIFQDATDAQLAFISEHQSDLPGIDIELDSQRVYPYGTLAGHVLGYIGPIPPSSLSYYANQKHYLFNQLIGLSGIEEQYENLLQGKVGEQDLQVTLQGNSMKNLGFNPVPTAGDNIRLTLDGRLQALTQNEVVKQYQSATRQFGYIPDVAAIALNPKTGGVLSMVSYPYMDPNWFTEPGAYSKHSNYMSTSGAESNFAIQWPNYPGSSMKPSTLIAGMTYGFDPNTQIDAEGSLDIMGYHAQDDAVFGVINAVKALAESSEVYYYSVGLFLGHWLGSTLTSPGGTGGIPLSTWQTKYYAKGLLEIYHTEWLFGLGPKTGIDLPGEFAAQFYDQDIGGKTVAQQEQPLTDILGLWKQLQKTGSLNLHHTETPVTLAQAATGQQQLVTPIQLATYTAALANNGVKVQPHLLEAVYKPGMKSSLTSKDKPIETVKTKATKLPFKLSTFKVVQQGMIQEANASYGTGYAVFQGSNPVPYTVAGKTGTAQIYIKGHKTDNSVFIAYAPVKNPQIAVAVMVPGAGYGSGAAAPIARAMMDAYFKEHHEFFPKKDWTSTAIPSNWKQTPAYTDPESAK